MNRSRQEILSPAGVVAVRGRSDQTIRKKGARKPVIGLLNNSKPNVSHFLEAVEKAIRGNGYRTLNVTKPRSAGPCPGIEALAQRCDYVINAVAD